jgi:PAS domain S-box-containing protein
MGIELTRLEFMPKRIQVNENNIINESLENGNANLAILIENIDNPVWSIDLHGRLVNYNIVFKDFFKNRFNIEAKPGLQIFEEIPFKEISEWKLLFDRAMIGEKLNAESKVKINNVNYYFDILVNPIFNNEKKIIGAVFISHNISQRKSSEYFLHESKAQLQTLIDNIPYLVWFKDNCGQFVIVNHEFQNFFKTGTNLQTINNLKVFNESPEFWEFICNDTEILNSGAKLIEERSFTINNETHWFEVNKSSIYGENLELVGITGTARDISNRKTIENILLESEEKFRQFAENTSDSFILCSNDAVLYVNPAFKKIYGRGLKEAYKHLHIPKDWVYPEDQEKVINFFTSEEYKKLGTFNGQYRIIRDDGTIAWVWERSFPVHNSLGQVIRFISVASDITRQKQLEEDLYKTKAQQQAILDNIPHMAWLKDLEGKYVSVNEAFAKFYNQSKSDIIGKTDSDICHPDLSELYAYNDYIVIKTKKQQQFDEFIDTSEGTVYTETIKTPIIDDNSEIIGITGISRDITYYKRIEQQLRSNDDKLKALLRNSTDSITVIDKNGKVIFDSSFFTKILGSMSDSFVGYSLLERIAEADREPFLHALQRVIETPDIQRKVEFSCFKQDGSIIYFESYLSNHLNNTLIGGIVVNSRDISERKEALKKEKEYQDKLIFLESTALDFLSFQKSDEIYDYIGKKIFEIIPESVILFSSYDERDDSLVIKNITGMDKFMGIVVDFLNSSPLDYHLALNDQIKRKLMSTANKLHTLSGGLFNICNRQIDFMVCKALEKLISLNRSYGMGIVRSGKLLGSIIILSRYGHIIKDARIIETFMYQASIALLRRRVEKELIIAKEKAEESDKLKTAFLANMSHEIRTPVNGIIGFSQLLEMDDIDNDKKKEFIEIIRSNATSLISLIDDILDISIIQEGQVKLRKSTININLLLDEVLAACNNPRFQTKSIDFKISKILPDDNAIIVSDSLRIKQILNNLISNAYKFTDKGTIEFGYNLEPKYVKFFVKDTGIGIHSDKIETIFERFMQGDASFTRRFGGSGLGLAISKGLVEIMGGTIWVESVYGEGSQFYFTIAVGENNWPSPETLIKSAKENPSLLN